MAGDIQHRSPPAEARLVFDFHAGDFPWIIITRRPFITAFPAKAGAGYAMNNKCPDSVAAASVAEDEPAGQAGVISARCRLVCKPASECASFLRCRLLKLETQQGHVVSRKCARCPASQIIAAVSSANSEYASPPMAMQRRLRDECEWQANRSRMIRLVTARRWGLLSCRPRGRCTRSRGGRGGYRQAARGRGRSSPRCARWRRWA